MRKYIYFIALICCALSASTSYAQKKVIKTMMIAGQDGSHYWRGACEAMKQILEVHTRYNRLLPWSDF